jgi:glucose/mannose-6-phosphate isomerase
VRVSSLLDRFEILKSLDSGGMLKITFQMSDQIEEILKAFSRIKDEIPRFSFSQIIFLGTGGGSRAALDLLHSYLFPVFPYPFYAYQGYNLPGFVNRETLAVLLSHSGETEESLFQFEEACSKTSKILIISGGGRLTQLAKKLGFPCFQVPAGMEARSAMPYLFFATLFGLARQGIPVKEEEILETIEFLQKERELLKEEIPTSRNPAKALALKLNGRIPFIYGAYGFSEGIAERLRRQLAENSKMLAHSNIVPNMHHDEIVGFEDKSLKTKVIAVLIRDFFEENRIRKRFDATLELLEEKGFNTLEVFPLNKGSKLARMFSLVQLIDYSSIYLALLRGFNPRDVFIIQKLKERMKE